MRNEQQQRKEGTKLLIMAMHVNCVGPKERKFESAAGEDKNLPQVPFRIRVIQLGPLPAEDDDEKERNAKTEEDHDGDCKDHHAMVRRVVAFEAIVGDHVVGARSIIDPMLSPLLFDELAIEEV